MSKMPVPKQGNWSAWFIESFKSIQTHKPYINFISSTCASTPWVHSICLVSPFAEGHWHAWKTQKFATKVSTKLWDWSYHELLAKLHLPTLTQRRLHINLCLLYKIIHGLMYFPPDIVTPSTTVTHNPRSLLLQEPFARPIMLAKILFYSVNI